eukprot:13774535-Ditylum_brightwellii.AAC.1
MKPLDIDVLVESWGDGSGTGTRGSLVLNSTSANLNQEEVWMGLWNSNAALLHSNWKELYTLIQTLEREQSLGCLVGHCVLYFTDNMVTYHVVQQGTSKAESLHKLVI